MRHTCRIHQQIIAVIGWNDYISVVTISKIQSICLLHSSMLAICETDKIGKKRRIYSSSCRSYFTRLGLRCLFAGRTAVRWGNSSRAMEGYRRGGGRWNAGWKRRMKRWYYEGASYPGRNRVWSGASKNINNTRMPLQGLRRKGNPFLWEIDVFANEWQ